MRPKIAKSKVKGSNDNEVAFSFAWDLPMMAESKHDDQSPPPKSKHYDPKEKLGRTIKYLKQWLQEEVKKLINIPTVDHEIVSTKV